MKTKSVSKIKIALAIPIAVITVFLFANPIEKAQSQVKTELATVQDTIEIEEVKVTKDGEYTIKETEGEVYDVVEIMPKFDGQTADAFRTYIMQNLKYPKEAQKNEEQGRVFVAFIVDKNGDVKDVNIARGVSPSLDKEAVRVIKSSPKWEPGLNKGIAVNVRYTFPIVFKLK